MITCSSSMQAQNQPSDPPQSVQQNPWRINGNNNTDSMHFLGTTTLQPLIFKTGGQERMRITENGSIISKGIINKDTLKTLGPLVIGNQTLYLSPSTTAGGGNHIYATDGSIFINSTDETFTENTILNAGSLNFGSVGINTFAPNANTKLDVEGRIRVGVLDQNDSLIKIVVSDSMGILHYRQASTLGGGTGDNDWAGAGSGNMFAANISDNVAVGTQTPSGKLHIKGKASAWSLFGQASNGNQLYGVFEQATGDGQLQVMNNTGTAVISFSAHTGTPSFINAGNVGIGTSNPGIFRLRVEGTTGQLAIRSDNNQFWDQTSDIRLKTDIDSFTDGLNVIRQINPITFRYNGKGNISDTDSVHIGIIAQEVLTVAPYTISGYQEKLDSTDIDSTKLLSFNAHGLFFALINAVKELDARSDSSYQLHQLDSILNEISAIRNHLAEIQDCMDNMPPGFCGNGSANKTFHTNTQTTSTKESKTKKIDLTSPDKVVLFQNVPNPFDDKTTIMYYIPQSAGLAYLVFYDEYGREIKKIEITQTGYGKTEASTRNLNDGIYTYSIVINGEIMSAKKMLKVK